jgi:lipopolysaccharide export system protein LptA/lipopolysaccharide export system protein LptC
VLTHKAPAQVEVILNRRMKKQRPWTPLSAQYARWAALAGALVALAAAAVFAWREWRSWRVARTLPAPVPPVVEQRSLEFSFSSVEGQQTIFTITARQATQFARKPESLLEDVRILVYGRRGNRHDEIRAEACRYDAAAHVFACGGTVAFTLSGLPGTLPALRIHTRNVTFARDSGVAFTDAPVEFAFADGHGRAQGVRYRSRTGDVELERAVEMEWIRAGRRAHVRAAALDYFGETRLLELRGPVRMQQGERQLTAGELQLHLDRALRPLDLTAQGEPVLVQEGPQPARLTATLARVEFDDAGRAAKVFASGGVRATMQAQGRTRIEADAAVLLLPVGAHARATAELEGNATWVYAAAGQSAQLAGPLLRLQLDANAEGHWAPVWAESPARSRLDWQQTDQALRVEADHLQAWFDPPGVLAHLQAVGSVRTTGKQAGQEPVLTEAAQLEAHFASGTWSSLDESGHVRILQGQREFRAARAVWEHASDTVRLSGGVLLQEPGEQLRAADVVWRRSAAQIQARGSVETISYRAETTTTDQPLHVTSNALDADTLRGEARFSGRARLWQDVAVLSADQIVLRRASRQVQAVGHVEAIFPQVARPEQPAELWQVTAPALLFSWPEQRAWLDGPVVAQTQAMRIQAGRAELQFVQRSGRMVLAQGLATAGIRIAQGGRTAEAERGSYDAARGEIVLTGGEPRVRDTSGNTLQGSRLTLFLGNDTILLESREGTRTVARHPISQ